MRRTRIGLILLLALSIPAVSVATAQDRARPRGCGGDQAARARQDSQRVGQEGQAKPAQQLRRRQTLPQDAETIVISLKFADARSLSSVIERLESAAGRACFVTSAASTNALIVAASGETLEQIRALVAELDRPASPPSAAGAGDEFVCTGVPLKAAFAEEVAEALEDLAPRPSRRTLIRIVADARANTVWLSGPNEQVSMLADMARSMDVNTAASTEGKRELHFFVLEHAPSLPTVNVVNQIAGMMDLDTRLVADPHSNAVIAYATPDQLERLAAVIAKLDVKPAKTVSVKSISFEKK